MFGTNKTEYNCKNKCKLGYTNDNTQDDRCLLVLPPLNEMHGGQTGVCCLKN